MYSPFRLASKYLRYYFTAANSKGHGIHSPFVFNFVKNVLRDKTHYPEYAAVEALRQSLLQDNSTLEILDLGAGSNKSNGSIRKVSEIARHAAKPAKYGQLLFRISRYYQPALILELGTSLGITTSYLALGNPAASIQTIEGSPGIAAKATENLKQLALEKVHIVTGDFNTCLGPALAMLNMGALIFIDGNHRKEPTLDYFFQILPRMQPGSILVFDDIHWSAEMEEAWQIIRDHPDVKLTVDLFFIGIVFFRDDFLIRQEFVVRF